MRAYYRSLKPLILWREVERPLCWARLFGRVAPVELEIGFGSGDYLVARAQQHPAVAARVIQEFQRLRAAAEDAPELICELTARETEILRLMAEGKRNREIADALFLSEKTVKNYISSILFKLQVNSRTEAALLAVKRGLI